MGKLNMEMSLRMRDSDQRFKVDVSENGLVIKIGRSIRSVFVSDVRILVDYGQACELMDWLAAGTAKYARLNDGEEL